MGTVAEDKKPFQTLHLCHYLLLLTEFNKPVEAQTEAAPVEKVTVFIFTYAFYDIRQTSDAGADIENKDGDVRSNQQPKMGKDVHQAIVNEAIAIATTNSPSSWSLG